MDEERRKRGGGVELPDSDSGDETFETVTKGLNSRVILFSLLVTVAVFIAIALLFFQGKEQVLASIPSFEKAWVVARLEGENVATDQPRTVLDGRGVMLYLLAYGTDKVTGESFYYTENPSDTLPKFIIAGKEIPADKVRVFDYLDTRAFVYWYKYEVSPLFLSDTTKPFAQRLYWTDSRKHKMGSRMWAIADVRGDLNPYHYDYVGTICYTAEVDVISTRIRDKLFTTVACEGYKPASLGAIPPGALRVTILPPFRNGLDKYYRAYFNNLAFENRNGSLPAEEATDEFRGGDSRSVLIGALRLMGYDISFADNAFLPKVADRLFERVSIDEFGYFRPNGDEKRVIPYGEGGVQNGDIIAQGNRYLVLVRNTPDPHEPAGGALTGDDVVLDAWNNFVRASFANVLEKDAGPIEIWRPRPLAAAAAHAD